MFKKIYFLKNWATDSSSYYGYKRKNLNSSSERDTAREPNYLAETVQISVRTPSLRTIAIVMNYLFPWKASASIPWYVIFSEGRYPFWAIKTWCIGFLSSSSPFEFGTKTKPFIFIFLRSFLALMNVFMRKKEKKDKICQETRENLKGDKTCERRKVRRRERRSRVRELEGEKGSVCRTLCPSLFIHSFPLSSVPHFHLLLLRFCLCLSELSGTRKAPCLSSQILFEWWNKSSLCIIAPCCSKSIFLKGAFYFIHFSY